MRISIITVCYNAAKTIKDTIQSVLSQTYKDIEYIIIDGASTDNTMAIVNKYKGRIAKIVSEKDKGMYDALNKGIALATGEVVGQLNADDFYFDKTVVERVAKAFHETGCDATYGDLQYIDKLNTRELARLWRAGDYTPWKLQIGWMPPHPTFFAKKSVYTSNGGYRLDMKLAADYELMLRFLKKGKIKMFYLPQTLVYMRAGGMGEKNMQSKLNEWKDVYRAWLVNGFGFPWLMPLRAITHTLQLFSRK
jgi:glycosyltransferase involved in cell wall biosynthesis